MSEVKSVKSMIKQFESGINSSTTTTNNNNKLTTTLPTSKSNSDLKSPTTNSSTTSTTTSSPIISKPIIDLKSKLIEAEGGNESESDLEDGLLSESVLFPAPASKKVIVPESTTTPTTTTSSTNLSPIDTTSTPTPTTSAKGVVTNEITTSPITASTPNSISRSIPSVATGGSESPLSKILESIEELSLKEQEIVKLNLERLGGYPTELPLSDSWTLYFSDTSRATKSSHSATQEQYTESQTPIFTVSSVPALCGSLKAYKRLVRSKRMRNNEPDNMGLTQFRAGMNLHCFREYSKPTWEDPWNQKGGRLTISPPSHLLDSTFERLVLLLTGSSLESSVSESLISSPSPNRKSTGPVIEGLIIGVVASKRARGDRVELWLGGKNENEPAPGEWVDRLKEVLSVELEMPELRTGKYKKHF